MAKIVCFSHPHYQNTTAPDLSCSTCVKLFTDRVHKEVEQKNQERISLIDKIQKQREINRRLQNESES